MIRWYDWIVAVFIADLLFAIVLYTITASGFWAWFWGVSSLWLTMAVWDDIYCTWRLDRERKRR